MLKDKVAYVIVTGANKANEITDFLRILEWGLILCGQSTFIAATLCQHLPAVIR